MEWTAASRPHKDFINIKLSRSLTIIALFVGFLLVLMKEFVLIFFVASIYFILYVLSKFSPEQVHYEISNHGVSYGDDMYYWEELKQFFFMSNSGFDILAIDTFVGLPGRLFLTIDARQKEALHKFLVEKIHYIEVEPKNVFDNLYSKISSKIKF